MLCLAALVAAASFFVQVQYEVGGISVVCCLLYLIAPFFIVRHLMLRPKIDTETLLGAVAAYLLIGMFFAFAYRGRVSLEVCRSSVRTDAARSARIYSLASSP